MKSPKEKRDQLFKSGRPFIRPLQIYDGDKYHKDISVLWVAHKRRPFQGVDHNITQAEFAREIDRISKNSDLLMVEDKNREYKDKGPVALIGVAGNDWKLEPNVEFFKWATPRNIFRTCVAYFQMVRSKRTHGACVVYSLPDSENLFDRCCEYGVLRKVGTIVNGNERGDEIIYHAVRIVYANRGHKEAKHVETVTIT